MRRREFIRLFSSTVVAWPLTARAQPQALPVIGFLNSASPQPWVNYVAGFRAGLKEIGYVDGQNVTIEFRWAEGYYDRLPGMAADLVHHKVAVLVATGGTPSIRAAKAATATIPIVFTTGSDPVRLGLVTSLSRPGGNITGVNLFLSVMESKRLGLLRALLPGVQLIAVLLNPDRPDHAFELKEVQEAAAAIGQQIHVLLASNASAIDTAFATAVRLRAGAMLVSSDPFFNSQRDKIIALAAQHTIPAIYEQREHTLAGGLMSYRTNITAMAITKLAFTREEFSRGRSRGTCRWCSRSNLSSSSTSKPPRRLALRCRRTSPPRRTRSSNRRECPLLGVKQTLVGRASMSANDPCRTWASGP